MKTKTSFFYLWSLVFGLFLCPAPHALSQIPQGFNYQAIARDGTGAILPNTSLQVMFYIQSLSTGGTLYWKELHSTVTTNSFGLFNLVIGSGVRQIESSVATFDLIDWTVTSKYLKTEIYYSSGWHTLGTSQLLTVPYAMVAEDLAGTVKKLSVKGETSGLEEALFEVKNKDGQTVFAVYNEGVRVYVSNGSKAVKGGFAVGGFGTDKAESTKYLFVGKDSVRIYLDTNPLTKGKKSGFAVGGYDLTKGTVQNYLDISEDSVRIYVDSNPTKKLKGGFAVGGYDMTKGTIQDYLDISSDSVRIYIDSNPSTKKVKGGFAVGGYDLTKAGTIGDYFNVTSSEVAELVKDEDKVLWYPSKSSLLAGKVHIVNPDSVGQNSTALGFKSEARGKQSQAFGYRSIAYGDYSTAIGFKAESDTNSMAVGYKAIASGGDAFAMGSGAQAIAPKSFAFGSVGIDSLGNVTGSTKALGKNSYAFGLGSIASARGAFALGANDTASGQFSYAAGYKTKASNWYSTSMGGYSQASGYYSTSIGYKAKSTQTACVSFGYATEATGAYSTATGHSAKAAGFYSLAAGNAPEARGSNSVALGYKNVVTNTGSYAMAIGRQDTASGQCSFAAGRESKATNYYSFVAGYKSVSSGSNSIALGTQVNATGSCSMAQGNLTTASNTNSVALNIGSKATGQNAIAAGYYTTAQAFASLVLGRFNVVSGDAANWGFTDPIFVIGNGNSVSDPINSFTILKNGKTAIGHASPAEMLDVNGNARFRSVASGTYQYNLNLTLDGTLTTATSDLSMKTNIETITGALDKVLNMRGVYFSWKNDPSLAKKVGFIAQEMELVSPEVVFTNPVDNLKGINYTDISPLLAEAIKEQQRIIDQQKTENNELKARLESLEKRMNELERINKLE
ncbi:MAG: tail fiber domain-containing protein [Bacteroidales bacterium]|jgi:hypothetical protein|nr:tail fiber domain-containing protein [Bacteroidales bacterium]